MLVQADLRADAEKRLGQTVKVSKWVDGKQVKEAKA